MKKTDSILEDFKLFIKDVFLFNPLEVFLTLLLMILTGVVNGIGMAALVPLLQMAGFGEISDTSNYLSKIVVSFFNFINISRSLIGVLVVFFFILLCVTILSYQQVKFSSTLSHNYSAYIRERLYRQIFNSQWPFFIKKKMAHCANILTVEAQRVRVACDSLIRIVSESFFSTEGSRGSRLGAVAVGQ